MLLPRWWNEERRALAKAILKRNGASSFELLLEKEAIRAIKPSTIDFHRENELREVLNGLIKSGRLRTHVMLTNQAWAYILFYNPRLYQP